MRKVDTTASNGYQGINMNYLVKSHLPTKAQALFDALKTKASITEAEQLFIKDSHRVAPNNYLTEEVLFKTGLTLHLEQEELHLNIAEKLKISAAPRSLGRIAFPNGEGILLVIFEGTTYAHLDLVTKKSDFKSSAKESFLRDVKELGFAGLRNPFLSRGSAYWKTDEKGLTIKVEDWTRLESISVEDAPTEVERVKELFEGLPD